MKQESSDRRKAQLALSVDFLTELEVDNWRNAVPDNKQLDRRKVQRRWHTWPEFTINLRLAPSDRRKMPVGSSDTPETDAEVKYSEQIFSRLYPSAKVYPVRDKLARVLERRLRVAECDLELLSIEKGQLKESLASAEQRSREYLGEMAIMSSKLEAAEHRCSPEFIRERLTEDELHVCLDNAVDDDAPIRRSVVNFENLRTGIVAVICREEKS